MIGETMQVADLKILAGKVLIKVKSNIKIIAGKASGISMRKAKSISVILIGFLVVLALIIIAIPRNDLDSTDPDTVSNGSLISDSSNSSESEITPGESSQSSSPTETDENSLIWQPLIIQINAYLKDFDGRAGVYVIDLSTRKSFGINENAPFVAANSIKLPIITFLYNEIATGKLSLTDKMIYDSRPYPEGDMTEGAGFIINEPDGTEFSIRRISQLAITISDNCAANMAIRKLGGIDNVASGLDMISATIPYRGEVIYFDYEGNEVFGRHRSSPRDLGIYARYLYDLWKNSSALYQPLIDDLSQTIFEFGIKSKLPPEIQVAHKIGTNSEFGAENDVGIVFSDVPFVICVTTENADREKGREVIADISLMVYEFLNK